jgi:steroid 5-alpha reductase family enzyme
MEIIFLTVFTYATLGFLYSVIFKRNDVADVMWGPGIFLAVLTGYIIGIWKIAYALPLLIIVFLWALRISLHIGTRFINKKEEDFRYKTWRETWKYFYVRSYLQVFLLQGFLMILVASSLIFNFGFNTVQSEYKFVFYNLGILIAFCALVFEAVADLQLKKFLAMKLATPTIMTTGLWKYSRHPNYFGEVSFWWGIFIATLPSSELFFINPLFLISPLAITYLILKVSGIPMLEAKYKDNQEFQKYKSVTSAFFPMLPKKN